MSESRVQAPERHGFDQFGQIGHPLRHHTQHETAHGQVRGQVRGPSQQGCQIDPDQPRRVSVCVDAVIAVPASRQSAETTQISPGARRYRSNARPCALPRETWTDPSSRKGKPRQGCDSARSMVRAGRSNAGVRASISSSSAAGTLPKRGRAKGSAWRTSLPVRLSGCGTSTGFQRREMTGRASNGVKGRATDPIGHLAEALCGSNPSGDAHLAADPRILRRATARRFDSLPGEGFAPQALQRGLCRCFT